MSGVEFFKVAAKNECSRWSFDDDIRNENTNLAINRIGKGIFVPKISAKFQVSRNSTFFAIGSCFAREIETALIRIGVNVSSRMNEFLNNDLFPLRKGVTSIFDFFNRYNIPSIVREVENISGNGDIQSSHNLIYEVGDGVYDDLHYTAALESADIDILINRRQWIGAASAKAYQSADVVVLTLGLAEAWYDNISKEYLNVLSSPNVVRRRPNQFDVRLIRFHDSINFIRNGIDILVRDGKKVILTVSPVPLQVTYFDNDIVLSNFEAKSILRTVCSEIVSEYEFVDYFPSFEMVHHSERSYAWRADGRHVQMPMVEKIMETALMAYLE